MKSDQKREQKWLVLRQLVAWQRRPYDELGELIDQPQHVECQGPSGRMYLIATYIYWDDKPGDAIRIIATIGDDRSFLTNSHQLISHGPSIRIPSNNYSVILKMGT